jgi:hypothetical protein
MIDYSEKRDFLRMTMDCPARYRLQDGEASGSAMVRNLSAGGILLLTDHPIEAETQVTIRVTPVKAITPPLSAVLSVVRCEPTADGRYAVGCAIARVLSEDEAYAELP